MPATNYKVTTDDTFYVVPHLEEARWYARWAKAWGIKHVRIDRTTRPVTGAPSH